MRHRSAWLPDPRQRLQHLGAGALTDAELLAVCLGTGGCGMSVEDFAGDLLERFGSLTALLEAPLPVLLQVPGIGPRQSGAAGGYP